MQEGLSDRLQPRKPVFHLAPATGWVNDPNGPLYYRGQYHLFYQHLPQGCEWAFGLVWGHAVSKDLVHWEHLPHALLPDPKTHDAAGCFSGCATVDTDGTPVILYTGVRLRDNPDSHPLPPNECDLKLPFIESQLLAVADPDDPHLIHWRKDPVPFLPLPPASMDLTGWRDPFVVERPSAANNHEWVVLIGSGIKNVGGTAVVYRTRDLRTPSSWQYDGLLCSGDGGTGAVWECPLVAPLKPLRRPSASATLGLGTGRRSFTHIGEDGLQQGGLDGLERGGGSSSSHVGGDDRYTHFYCISPDAPTNPSLYWIGHYSDGRFDLANAKGPFRLDLGDILYAPNIFEDGNGRLLMWGWLQERRAVGQYDYAGCMSLPRALYIDPEHQQLWQEPAPELKKLRTGEDWRDTDLALVPGQPLPLQRLRGCNLDIEATFRQGSATTVGLLLRSWQSEEAPGQGTAAVLYHWESQVLEVVFEALDPVTMTYSLTAPGARRIGQQLRQPLGQPVITLRVVVDYSVLEVFTSTGEVLSTRAYRGVPPDAEDAGIEFVAIDGDAVLARVEAFEMRSIWEPLDAHSSSSAAAAAGRPADMEAVFERLLSPAASAKEGLSTGVSREGSFVSHKSSELLMARGLEKLSGSRPPSGTNVTYPGDARVLPLSPRLVAGASPRAAAPGYSPAAAAVAADALAGLDLGLDLGLSVEGLTQGVPEEEMTLDIFGDLVGTP